MFVKGQWDCLPIGENVYNLSLLPNNNKEPSYRILSNRKYIK